MTNIDTMIAPQPLSATDLLSVITPQVTAYATAHRAFIFAGILSDGTAPDCATVSACESALQSIIDDAITSLGEWLSDMEGDGEPRFYRKASLKPAVALICQEAGRMAARQETAADMATFIELLFDRDRGLTMTLLQVSDAPAVS